MQPTVAGARSRFRLLKPLLPPPRALSPAVADLVLVRPYEPPRDQRSPQIEFVARMRRFASLRMLSFQSLLVFLALGAVLVGVIAVVRLVQPDWRPNPVVTLVAIFVCGSEIIIWLAYRRGVRDARADSERSSDMTH